MKQRSYLVIDLKSFYASVECVERGLDPMTTRLVVADPERTDKTICLAVTPALKALGVRSRCRVFEIPKGMDYIMAVPRMKLYLDYAADIYSIYLKYLSKDDIHVYSIDEAFLDVTDYLPLYRMTPRELGQTVMQDILSSTGIRATCGIGTNLYLAKVALDITAKHAPDFIGYLDEDLYQKTLWNHRPLTDFWRIGRGIAGRLESIGVRTMGDLARCDEDTLYRMFGVDAELMIDHAWGREPTTMADIKSYVPKTTCLTSGQVLMCDYSFEKGKLIVKEMMDLLCLDLVDKGMITDSITLYVGYSNALHKEPARGTASLPVQTNADTLLIPAAVKLYEQTVDPALPIRRVNLTCSRLAPEEYRQYSLFDFSEDQARTRKLQKAVLDIKKKYGKNAILKGMNLEEGATTVERNRQIGGHKSGE